PARSVRLLLNPSAMPSRSPSSLLATSNQTRRRGSLPPPLLSLSPPTMFRSSVLPLGSTRSPGELSSLTPATSSPSVGAAGGTAILPVFARPTALSVLSAPIPTFAPLIDAPIQPAQQGATLGLCLPAA